MTTRLLTLLLFGFAGVASLCAADPDTLSYADYQRLLTWKMSTGKFTVIANDAPQSMVSVSASDSRGSNLFTLNLASMENPKAAKYEYLDGHPIDEVKTIDVLFRKALDWKDIATANDVESLTKSLGTYNTQEFFFRVTGDDAKDGIYLDVGAHTPTFSIAVVRQLHTIFEFLTFLDSYQGGKHLFEGYLLQSRQDADALFK